MPAWISPLAFHPGSYDITAATEEEEEGAFWNGLEWTGLWHFMKFWGTRRARNSKDFLFAFGHKPILDNSLTWQTLTIGTSMEFTICALCKRGEEEEKSISAPYQKAFAHLGMHEIRGLPLSTRLSIQLRPNRSPRTPKPQRGVGSRAGQIL